MNPSGFELTKQDDSSVKLLSVGPDDSVGQPRSELPKSGGVFYVLKSLAIYEALMCNCLNIKSTGSSE